MVRALLKKFERLGENVPFKLAHSVYELDGLPTSFDK